VTTLSAASATPILFITAISAVMPLAIHVRGIVEGNLMYVPKQQPAPGIVA
jgi:hypothetical protein